MPAAPERPTALIGAASTLVALVSIVALVVTGRRYHQRACRILMEKYLETAHVSIERSYRRDQCSSGTLIALPLPEITGRY